jgi:hypothetical protein
MRITVPPITTGFPSTPIADGVPTLVKDSTYRDIPDTVTALEDYDAGSSPVTEPSWQIVADDATLSQFGLDDRRE